MEKVVAQYLRLYAEPEAKDLSDSLATNQSTLGVYRHCLVIPAFKENYSDLLKVWRRLPQDTLIIIVINSYLTCDHQTARLFDDICKQSLIKRLTERVSFLRKKQDKDILVVDRCHPSTIIPKKNGVGLARKIGADIALMLITKKIILESKIAVTDADVCLPPNYFKPDMNLGDAALIYPFRHYATNDLVEGILLYEIFMLYYTAGIKWSGSPYGFTTIGSVIMLSPEYYSQVRGFPKKNAAEDFYLLNKLAKVGNIRSIKAPIIEIKARLSKRVPFGTGPALLKIQDLSKPLEDYKFYNPWIFTELRNFLRTFSLIWETTDVRILYRDWPNLDRYCEKLGFYSLIEKRRNETNSALAFNRCLNEWFDGFKTLRFIHEMREHYPSVSVTKIKEAPFIKDYKTLNKLRDQLAKRCLD